MSVKSCIKPTVRPASNSAVSGGSGEAPAGYLVQDTFTDSDGTALASHTPDVDSVGGGWTVVAGGWRITSNKADPDTASGNDQVAFIETGVADVRIDALVTALGLQSVHLVARYSDINTYWYVMISRAGVIRIYEVSGGTHTNRASQNITISAGVEYPAYATFNGQTITGVFNDSVTVSYNSAASNETETIVGLGSTSSDNRVDNFEVIAL